MTYVTDTHPLLWYLAGDRRLSQAAEATFDEAESGAALVVVPAIVLAETIRVVEKKRLLLEFDGVLRAIQRSSNYRVLPLDMAVISILPKLTILSELHDRIIVASADLLGAPLITCDSAIARSGYLKIIW